MSGSVDIVARTALSLPETDQGQHFHIPDFRVRGKVFTTARTDEPIAMVKLSQQLQEALVAEHPDAISPAAGAWGRRGATLVRTDRVAPALLADLIRLSWRQVAPKALVSVWLADHEEGA